MSEISVAGLTKRFAARPPVVALDRVDLDVASGSITAVLGPSGCGKSTLLRLIAGFERPDDGTITIAGRVVASTSQWVPPERRRIGIVPQEGALFPHLDVAGNVGFALRHRRSDTARARVVELLELVGLEGYERRRPHELSGGQQQRVALARALAARPAVVLLDEPFTALDHGLRARVRADVAAVIRHEEATAIIVTHDPGEAMSIGDTIAVMRAGRIVQVAPGREIYAHPADFATAAMLGKVVVLRGRRSGGAILTALGPIAVPAPSSSDGDSDGEVDVLVRPEQLRPDPGGVPLRVIDVEFQGHDGLVTLDASDHASDDASNDASDLVVHARWMADELPVPGATTLVRIAGPALLVVPVAAGGERS